MLLEKIGEKQQRDENVPFCMNRAEKYYIHIGKASELEKRSERITYRALEAFPGLLAWITIAAMFLFSWIIPVAAAVFIIVFDVYWFFKTIFLSLHLRAALKKMRDVEKKNWLHILEEKEGGEEKRTTYRDVYHLVIFPFYNEPYEVVRGSLAALKNSNYPKSKFIVVLSGEERAEKHTHDALVRAQEEFGNVFLKFLCTVHPKDTPGELAGKGANETWAAREAKRLLIDPAHIPYENILVSVFDADTQIGPEYFGRLTHAFLTSEHPQRSSYQPIPFFLNNIFQAPAFARVISFSATFWHLMQQARPDKLTTFSSHSMPFRALVDIGYWQTNIVSEDSRIFWQCYLYYNGDWRVEPLYYSVSMDANVAPSFFKTAANQYKQQRRWGYGAENIPYLLFGFLKNKAIPLKEKARQSFIKIEAFHSWATNALMIFLMGWLPLWLGGKEFKLSLLSFNLPEVTRFILLFASVGIVTSAVLSVIMLPRSKPKGFRLWHYGWYFLQWILLPLVLIFFGAFPGLEAQTRLMFGKYMSFWVTPKYRSTR